MKYCSCTNKLLSYFHCYKTEDSIGQAMEYRNKAARLLVKLKRWKTMKYILTIN